MFLIRKFIVKTSSSEYVKMILGLFKCISRTRIWLIQMRDKCFFYYIKWEREIIGTTDHEWVILGGRRVWASATRCESPAYEYDPL